MRVVAAAVVLALSAAACNASMNPQESAEVRAQKEREDAETRIACERFKREVGGRVDSPDEFGRVFDQLARDAGAPDSYRDTVREVWGNRTPDPSADPEQFKKEMDKFADRCREVGAPID